MPRALVLVLLLALLTACGRGPDDAPPPEDTLFVPLPADEQEQALMVSSALCASDTEAYDRLAAFVETYNEAIQDKIALIRAVVRSSKRQLQREGEVEYSVEREGRTLTLRVMLEDDGSVTYTVDFAGPSVTYTVLRGTRASDGASGAWTTYRPSGEQAVQATWTYDEAEDVLTVERAVQVAQGERRSTYTRTPAAVTLSFTGPSHTAEAAWDRETLAGSIEVDGETKRCFEAGETRGDFCSVECPAEG